MLRLKNLSIVESKEELRKIPEGKVLINTIYAYSYVVAQKDTFFADALRNCDYLMPDGASIVKACRWLNAKCQPQERIPGWDLFMTEMQALNNKAKRARVMFLGSNEDVLTRIRERVAVDFPSLDVVTYSPPYKKDFSDDDNLKMIQAINETNPDLLWIGMTAPKQEKWTYKHWDKLNIHCHVGTIGAVFDFYAGTSKRAPLWWQNHSLEWLYRLIQEPQRMWKRYLIGNPLFIWNIMKEAISHN
ncbi:MAG: WecB/TagA/CpsF family glycosyltransferase [Bacteroidaceae bacterium]|nr:WecB/TagA/CpsF family glycosyltransferase [Bacteroidaceae bacterium]